MESDKWHSFLSQKIFQIMQTGDSVTKHHNLTMKIPFDFLQQDLMLIEFVTVQELMLDVLQVQVHIFVHKLLEFHLVLFWIFIFLALQVYRQLHFFVQF